MSKDLTLLVPEETLKICQFITRHSTQLPCQVKLLETSTAFPQPLPEDRIINLHFMKHSKVVIMRDSASGDMISVPLNSAAKFGLLYNPCSNAKKAMNGYNFHTAREIMATKPLPFLVQATQSYQGSSATTSVVQGEILCIKGVKTFLRSKQLRVQNMQGENKLLSEKCCGSFTTAPAKLSMPLLPLLKFDTELPATVATSVGRERGHSSVLEMERIAGETCLIASYPTWQYTKQHYFEITSDVDISVESVKMDSSLKQDLLTDTQALFHTFSRSAVPIVSEAHAQRGVSGELLPGEERHGVQLVRPINIDILPFEDSLPTSIASQSHEPIISRVPVKMAAAAVDSESEEIYCVLDAIKPESHESSESSLMTSQPPSRHPRMSVREQPSGDNDMVWINLMSKVEDMSSAYLQKLNCIQEELQSLQSIVLNIQKTVQHFQPAQPVVNEEHEKNKREIACLDCNQVIFLFHLTTYYSLHHLLSSYNYRL